MSEIDAQQMDEPTEERPREDMLLQLVERLVDRLTSANQEQFEALGRQVERLGDRFEAVGGRLEQRLGEVERAPTTAWSTRLLAVAVVVVLAALLGVNVYGEVLGMELRVEQPVSAEVSE